MKVARLLVFVCLVACSSEAPTRADGFSPPSELVEPKGPEFMGLSKGAFTLAPGREDDLIVSSFIIISSSAMTPVAPRVAFESSNANVASVVQDSTGRGHIVARNPGTATITVRSLREGNLTKTATVTVQPAPVGNEAGLVYSATVKIVPTSRGAGAFVAGPVDLEVQAIISNPTNGQRDIWLGGCPAWIRIYENANLTGKPRIDLPRTGGDCFEPRHHIIEPGKADTLIAVGYRLDLDPDTLTTGRYYVVAAVDRVRDLYDVPAGPVDIVSAIAGLSFGATTSVSDGDVKVSASVTNTNAFPMRLEYGACAVGILAYRTPERTGAPAWNSDARGRVCLRYLATATIQPGARLSPAELNAAVPVAEMLGDSLSSGRYYFSTRIRMNWRSVTVAAGDADVRR